MKNKLKDLLQECHDKGYLTDEFALEAMAKAKIHIDKRWTIPFAVRDDAYGNFCLKLVKYWHKIDPKKSPFSFLNMMAGNVLTDELRKYDRHEKKLNAVGQFNQEYKEISNAPPRTSLKLEFTDRNQQYDLRKFVIALLKKNSLREVSRITGISRKSIYRWREKYKKHGSAFYKTDGRRTNACKKR